jgi:pimeloyl-ACP methyl ester carboxylesterase
MPMLRVNGTELYYEDTGGSGPAILFSHGLFWDSSLHRGNETPCRLAPDGIAAIDQWPEILRDALSKNYDRLDEVLATMKPVERKDMR